MSYEHGTTHYNLPQTEGSDTRDWFDTNEAFRAVDEALYSANQTGVQITSDIETVKEDVSDLKDADTAMTGRVDGIEGRVAANELKIGRLETEVTDGVQDLKDSICAIEEASATAAYPHNTGEFFWYNDTLYKATANIAIGQQIVPDTNCKTTNITTELLNLPAFIEIDDSVVAFNKVWSSSKVNSVVSVKANTNDVYIKDEVYTKAEVDALIAGIGGGGMPILDYGNPLHSFTAGNLSYTATRECWLGGRLSNAATNIQVDNITVAGTINVSAQGGSSGFSAALDYCLPFIHIGAGQTITLNVANPDVHVFAVLD